MHDIVQNHRARQVEAARRYAAADKTDPFAFARAMTHINNGVCRRPTLHGETVSYDADEAQEMRKLEDGTEYAATIYRNVQRP